MLEDVLDEVPEDVPEDVLGDVPEDVPDEVPDETRLPALVVDVDALDVMAVPEPDEPELADPDFLGYSSLPDRGLVGMPSRRAISGTMSAKPETTGLLVPANDSVGR